MLLMGLHRASASVPTFIALHWFCIKGNNMVKPCNEQSALCWRKRINRTFRLLVRTKQWIMPPVCSADVMLVQCFHFSDRGSSGIGMTPFYRSVPARVVWSDIGQGAGQGAGKVQHWPAYQLMAKERGEILKLKLPDPLIYFWLVTNHQIKQK